MAKVIRMSVESVDHAAKLAKALRDIRYTKLGMAKIDAAFGLNLLKILYGMPELRVEE